MSWVLGALGTVLFVVVMAVVLVVMMSAFEAFVFWALDRLGLW